MYVDQEEKLYLVLREFICYHSTVLKVHFDKETCIRNELPFTKAKYVKNNAKHLYDCVPEQFDMLLMCMIQGSISKRWINACEAIEECIAFLGYSASLDMEDMVSEAVFETARNAIKNQTVPPAAADSRISRRELPSCGFTAEHIKVIFKSTKHGNALRVLTAQDILSRQGSKGTTYKTSTTTISERTPNTWERDPPYLLPNLARISLKSIFKSKTSVNETQITVRESLHPESSSSMVVQLPSSSPPPVQRPKPEKFIMAS